MQRHYLAKLGWEQWLRERTHTANNKHVKCWLINLRSRQPGSAKHKFCRWGYSSPVNFFCWKEHRTQSLTETQVGQWGVPRKGQSFEPESFTQAWENSCRTLSEIQKRRVYSADTNWMNSLSWLRKHNQRLTDWDTNVNRSQVDYQQLPPHAGGRRQSVACTRPRI